MEETLENAELSELDLALIHAIQISPRASWQRLAEALDVAPSTLSRRWARLAATRRAWVATAPGRNHLEVGASAFLLLRVDPAHQAAVTEALCAEPATGTVERVAGSHDFLVDCFAPTRDDLTHFLTGPGTTLPGVTGRDILFTTRMHRDGSAWRAGALAPGPAGRLGEGQSGYPVPTVRDAVDVALIEALGADGRASWSELGAVCGLAPQTARRRTESLLAAGVFSLRCEAATAVRQGRRAVTLLLDVPPEQLDALGRWFGDRPDCRVSAEVLGIGNLLVSLWVPHLAQLHDIEREAAALAPGVRVVGREVELASVKRVGHRLDAAGRRMGRVPVPLVRARA